MGGPKARLIVMLMCVALPAGGRHALGAASMFPDSATAPAREAGVVEGVVRVDAAESEPPPMLSPYSRRRYRPPPPSSGGRATPENVVVFVVPEDPLRPPSSEGDPGSRPTARITQRDRTIIPHVTAVRVGTRIEFPNEDDVYHNLFSLSDPGPFNLGRYPPGDSRSEIFDEPGVIRMFCDIHSEMTGVIRVLDTPYFTRPDPDGRFRISGVPDGTRTVVAWHDQLGADTVQVTVSPSSTARVEFHLPR